MPDNPRLVDVVRRAEESLADADRLGALLRGGHDRGLGPGSYDAYLEQRGRLLALLAELEGFDEARGEDEIDRLALVYGLRRAIPLEDVRAPLGAVLLERHLLVRLPRLAAEPLEAAAGIAGVLEEAPAFLAESREGALGAPSAAGGVALAAAKRLPALFDAISRAVDEVDIDAGLRQRVEAALGSALAAAAEDGGWLLKEWQPASRGYGVGFSQGSGEQLGLRASYDELEAAAEQVLADEAALASLGDAQTDPAGQDPPASRRWGVGDVAAAWRRLADDFRHFVRAPADVEVVVEPAPGWLAPLLAPLALVDPGALSSEPLRLLVSPTLFGSEATITPMLRTTWMLDFLPAAWQRRAALARLLLPSGDATAFWRAALRLGPAQPDEATARRESSWRAMLALVALGVARGRLDAAEATDLLVAETGMDVETAALQVAHVATSPVAALTAMAGARIAEAWVQRLALMPPPEAAAARAEILRAGPLPAACLEMVAGYTP